MQLLAPAKINLSFQVKGRRADGFHEIETLMVPISLADEITIEAIEAESELRFTCDDPSLPVGDDNLVVRAARLFRERTGVRPGIAIQLKKKIPHGAGLGGGSSDAASTLLCLNEMFETGLTREDLLHLAAQLGSDVPFFIVRSPATCRGRGELVVTVSLSATFEALLLKPAFAVPTPWAYKRWNDSRELPGIDYLPQGFGEFRCANDLERPVFEKFVMLARLKTWLRQEPEVGAALMSGSGSTMFALLHDGANAEALAARAKAAIDPELWTCGVSLFSSASRRDTRD